VVKEKRECTTNVKEKISRKSAVEDIYITISQTLVLSKQCLHESKCSFEKRSTVESYGECRRQSA